MSYCLPSIQHRSKKWKRLMSSLPLSRTSPTRSSSRQCTSFSERYPAIRVLRYCDKGERCMDKLYYLTKRATDAINRSKDHLINDPENFHFDEDVTLVM